MVLDPACPAGELIAKYRQIRVGMLGANDRRVLVATKKLSTCEEAGSCSVKKKGGNEG
ncbi:MAG TPA: hypothetical protein PKA61_08130 [Nitrospira sp.]|nr:hypothetical protein [Nitrospira sp.]